MVRLLDTTLVCAATTMLIVRTQLWLTNYPQPDERVAGTGGFEVRWCANSAPTCPGASLNG